MTKLAYHNTELVRIHAPWPKCYSNYLCILLQPISNVENSLCRILRCCRNYFFFLRLTLSEQYPFLTMKKIPRKLNSLKMKCTSVCQAKYVKKCCLSCCSHHSFMNCSWYSSSLLNGCIGGMGGQRTGVKHRKYGGAVIDDL